MWEFWLASAGRRTVAGAEIALSRSYEAYNYAGMSIIVLTAPPRTYAITPRNNVVTAYIILLAFARFSTSLLWLSV